MSTYIRLLEHSTAGMGRYIWKMHQTIFSHICTRTFHIFVPGLFTYLYQNFSHICTRTYILHFHLYKRKKKSFYFIIIRNCPSHAYFVFFCLSGFLLVQLFRYSVIFISIHSKTDIHFCTEYHFCYLTVSYLLVLC